MSAPSSRASSRAPSSGASSRSSTPERSETPLGVVYAGEYDMKTLWDFREKMVLKLTPIKHYRDLIQDLSEGDPEVDVDDYENSLDLARTRAKSIKKEMHRHPLIKLHDKVNSWNFRDVCDRDASMIDEGIAGMWTGDPDPAHWKATITHYLGPKREANDWTVYLPANENPKDLAARRKVEDDRRRREQEKKKKYEAENATPEYKLKEDEAKRIDEAVARRAERRDTELAEVKKELKRQQKKKYVARKTEQVNERSQGIKAPKRRESSSLSSHGLSGIDPDFLKDKSQVLMPERVAGLIDEEKKRGRQSHRRGGDRYGSGSSTPRASSGDGSRLKKNEVD